MSKEIALKWIDENEKRIIEISDKIWEYAEVGLLEYNTSKLLSEYIENHGFKVERCIAGMPTAFVATWGSGNPVIGIMGELDALPGLSQKAVPYREPFRKRGAGHGCGHNIYGTSGMAGAIAVKVAMEYANIPGTIKFYGCPAEETLVGKVWLVRDGYFNGVDTVFSHHPSQSNTAWFVTTKAMNSVKFHFYGVSSHSAAAPELGRSALNAAQLMNVGVNYMRGHLIQEARINSVLEEGGHQPNVVPSYARTWYYIRAPTREQVDQIYNWVLKIADAADMMAGTTHKIEIITACYNKLPNMLLSELVIENMREIEPPRHTDKELEFAKELNKYINPEQKKESLKKSKHPNWEKMLNKLFDESVLDVNKEVKMMGGSTDTGDVSWVTPTITFGTASCTLGTPLHSWKFTAQAGMSIGHKSLIFGSKVNAISVLDLMMNPTLLKKVRDEWKERLAGRVYVTAIPTDLKPPLHQLEKYARSLRND